MTFILDDLIGWTAAALATVGALYTLVALGLSRRFFRRRVPLFTASPAVTIIKPLHGAHERLLPALEGFCRQDYDGEVQIVFGVADARDPAVAVVRRLQASHPHIDIDLVIDDAQHGVNRKASNLINIGRRAKHEVLILSDADIVVDPRYLRTVVSALQAPGAGAVTCLYAGLDDGSLWSRLSAMAIDYQFLPGAVLGKTLGLAQPCFGSTIGLYAATLDRIGGFHAIANHLADDYEIGRAVRKLGLRVDIPPMVVRHYSPEASSSQLIDHELRWAHTVRQIDPAGHAGSVVAHPLPLSLIALAMLHDGLAAGLFAAVLAVRMAAKAGIDGATGARAGAYALIPLRDVLSFGVFLGSFMVNTVGWQGRRFRVGRGGALLHEIV